jgi:hypothetical protein
MRYFSRVHALAVTMLYEAQAYLHKLGPQVLRHVILNHGDEEESGAHTRDGQLEARVFGGQPAQDPS